MERRGMRVRLSRILGGAFGVILAFVVAFPLLYASLTTEQRGDAPALPMPAPGTYHVYVADWGYHTSVIVEQPPGWALGPPGEERAAYLEYAWGDRRFYLESDYRLHSLFATMALPTASVLYLAGRSNPPRLTGAHAAFVRTVDATTVRALFVALEASALRHGGERPSPYPRAVGYSGRFYAAHGAYLWTRDCNWWTIRRLAEAGLAGSSTAVVFSGQVRSRLLGFQVVSSFNR
jgi:hypothetical protein